MKITKSKLREIIREEFQKLNEVGRGDNWAEKYVNDENIYKKLDWYIMRGKGKEKKIKGKEYILMSDGSALVFDKKDSEWKLAKYTPNMLTGKSIYK